MTLPVFVIMLLVKFYSTICPSRFNCILAPFPLIPPHIKAPHSPSFHPPSFHFSIPLEICSLPRWSHQLSGDRPFLSFKGLAFGSQVGTRFHGNSSHAFISYHRLK